MALRIYGYARVSRDEDKENYDTIITQKKMIKNYASTQLGSSVIYIFEDDNISGYIFNRRELARLKELIELNQVDILLTKDLSRIGRHNAKTLLFLEYLEEYNVRLILIHDNYDSDKDDDDIIGIKTWYNEKYIKDLSRKIKANLSTKQSEGGLITKVPFGYIRDPDNKHRLIIDAEAAAIVARIFQLYLGGHGGRIIANILNRERVLTPSKYQYIKTGKKISSSVAEKWNGTHVLRIIKNDVYIGILRCGKTKRKKVNGKTHFVDDDKHVIYEDYHEPIISKEDFELAQKIIDNRVNNNVRGTSAGINLFAGFLKCGDCGGGFMKVKKKRSPPSYICTNNHLYGAKFCSSHKINERELIKIILDKLEMLKRYIEDHLDQLDIEINNLTNCNQSYGESIAEYNIRITEKKEEIKNYSRQLAKGIIIEEIATEMINEANRELTLLISQLNELTHLQEADLHIKKDTIKSLDILNEIIQKGELTRRNLESLVKRITINQLSKADHGVKPLLNIDIEWEVFI